MPLKKGTSKKTISKNIKAEMHSYEKTGTIGNSKPASKKKAQKQAIAIAYSKARESGATLPKKKSSAKKSTSTTSTTKKRSASTSKTKRPSTARRTRAA